MCCVIFGDKNIHKTQTKYFETKYNHEVSNKLFHLSASSTLCFLCPSQCDC